MVPISHRKFVRDWKPTCHFCQRRTTRASHLKNANARLTPMCIRCWRALGKILECNARTIANMPDAILLVRPEFAKHRQGVNSQ